MSNMVRNPTALHYRAGEIGSAWYTRYATVPPGFGVLAGWSRLCPSLAVRVGIAVLVLMPFCTVARTFSGTNPLEQTLSVLVLALVVSTMQMLVESYIAVRTGPAVRAEPAVSTGCAAQPTVAQAPITAVAATLPPQPATHKAFDDMVRRALTHLCDPTKLSLSPLLQLSLITTTLQEQDLEDTRLQRVAVLKTLLTDLVNSLRPQQRANGCTSAAHRFYNCLYYPYVRGITRRTAPAVVRRLRERRERDGGPHTEEERVLEWLLQVNEDTYYKWQRRASDTIALILREREHRLIGSPSSGEMPMGDLPRAG